MTHLEELKEAFSKSVKYSGYVADDDVGYFVDWLIDELAKMTTERDVAVKEVDRLMRMHHPKEEIS
jgi:hypothetical protein